MGHKLWPVAFVYIYRVARFIIVSGVRGNGDTCDRCTLEILKMIHLNLSAPYNRPFFGLLQLQL